MSHLMSGLFTEIAEGNSSRVSPWIASTIQQRASQLAIDALAAAYLGKVNRHQPALQTGASLYTQVLRHFRRDLQDQKRAFHQTMLINSLFLAVYELITFRDPNGWLMHYRGIGRLV